MKYIDADRLRAEIETLKSVLIDPRCSQSNILGPDWVAGGIIMLGKISSVITSLQQEQPELPNNERKGIPGRDFIPVDWVEACERYGKWKIVKQEQPEADLEKEFQEYWYLHQYDHRLRRQVMDGHGKAVLRNVARHFYELGRISQTK